MTPKEKIEQLIEKAEGLIKDGVSPSDTGFIAWRNSAIRFLEKQYGSDSQEFNQFNDISFVRRYQRPRYGYGENDSHQNKCVEGLNQAKAHLECLVNEMNEKVLDNDCEAGNTREKRSMPLQNMVFIVHGHDGELKEAVARMLEKVGLTAIILSEQANGGLTIIEKFEKNSNVGAAICLFTADDDCMSDHGMVQKRARQNVVFETGYFCGKLGRDRVVIVADNGVEFPSDIRDVVHSDSENWQISVCRELNKMGYAIDLNKLL